VLVFCYLRTEFSDENSGAADPKRFGLVGVEGAIIEPYGKLNPTGSIETFSPVPVSVTTNECSSP